jgi:hypothetical protein
MDAAWGANGWLYAGGHRSINPDIWYKAVLQTAEAWRGTIEAGGNVWIAEGGQSDFTADVIRELRNDYAPSLTRIRIHIVQNSSWNEKQTSTADCKYANANAHHISIADGDLPDNGTAVFRMYYNDNKMEITDFMQTASSHSLYGTMWNAAFTYLNPINGYPQNNSDPKNRKLDFSDAVELLHILGIGTASVNDCNDFADLFLVDENDDIRPETTGGPSTVLANTDSDGDGMPDDWEKQYGLNPLVNDADKDPDGDGLTNLMEYRMQTDPTTAGSQGTRIQYEYDSLGRLRKILRVSYQ